jgi:lipid II:glycine glycyltransferase (peptidoglycan interpeptide bridge formation enzyme)
MEKRSSHIFLQTFINEIPDGWEAFVDGSDLYNIFQTAQWAKAVNDAGMKTILTIAGNKKDELKAGLLGIYNEYRFFELRVIPTVQAWGGPIFHDRNDTELIETLLRAFEKEAKKKGVINASIRSFTPFDNILIGKLRYSMEPNGLPCTVLVDLTRPIEEIWKMMEKRGRTGIRKALKQELQVEEAKTQGDLLSYYELSKVAASRLKTSPISFRLMSALWKTFSSQNKFKLFLATHKGKTVAGAIIVRWKDKMWYWHGASLEESWPLNANHLIQWNIIEWGVKNNLKVYDLMGVPCEKNNAHPKYGLYLFKSQFGGEIARHGEYTKTYLPMRHILFAKIVRPIRARIHKAN